MSTGVSGSGGSSLEDEIGEPKGKNGTFIHS